MNTIILGANGNLGSQLKAKFANDISAAWDHADFNYLDFDELTRRLDKIGPQLIINAAAYNAVDKCEIDKQEEALSLKLNRDLPAFLADYCLKSQAALLHYSTDYVFGADDRKNNPYTELDRPAPLNKYGISKLAGEKEIVKRALKGLQYYIVRTSKLFGEKSNNELSKASFFEVMIKLAHENKVVKVVDAEMSCFTYTADLASASLALCNDAAPRGIYHLTNSGQATWYEAALFLFNHLGLDLELMAIKPSDWPRPAKRPNFSVLGNTRRRPLRSWQEALIEYLSIIDLNKI